MRNYNLPTADNERVNELDAIRAFALLGILMMNMMAFAGSHTDLFGGGGLTEAYTTDVNQGALYLINTLVTSNFFTMFSFLFGLGFFIFFSRAKLKSGNPYIVFTRRLLVLLVIGIIHGVFIWYGDILTVYALTGFWLLLFFRFKPIVNLIVPLSIFAIGVIISIFSVISANVFMDEEMFDDAVLSETVIDGPLHHAMHDGNYLDLISVNVTQFGLGLLSIIIVSPIVLAMFLLGLYAGQKGYHLNLKSRTGWLLKVGIITLVIGLPIKLYSGHSLTYAEGVTDSIPAMFSYTIGGPLMAIAYITLSAYIFTKTPGLVKLLQPAGKMALTNYLMQSVVMVTFFKVTGLFNYLDAVWFIPLAITLFAIQVLLSNVWLKYFKFGPMEWLWRLLTYLRYVPIKR